MSLLNVEPTGPTEPAVLTQLLLVTATSSIHHSDCSQHQLQHHRQPPAAAIDPSAQPQDTSTRGTCPRSVTSSFHQPVRLMSAESWKLNNLSSEHPSLHWPYPLTSNIVTPTATTGFMSCLHCSEIDLSFGQ